MQKVKNIGGLGKHLDRSSQGEYNIPNNANSDQIENNIHWDKSGKSYSQKEWTAYSEKNTLATRINTEIKKRYKVDKKIRKDAVKAVEYIMTSDNLKMHEIFSDQNLYQSWVRDNKLFLESQFGKENIISMHLHMDEQTPHLHVVIVPITEDGRLSCKLFIDGAEDLSMQQTAYAKVMEKYGMKRGVQGSNAKHQRPNMHLKQNRTYVRN